MNAIAIELPVQTMITRLFAILKGWGAEMDHFRYEMFARRLTAAENGRPDAVAWATDWYRDVRLSEELDKVAQLRRQAEQAREREADRQQVGEGRCSNPVYQAFLDTVEDPGAGVADAQASAVMNANYMAWVSKLLARHEATKNFRAMSAPEKASLWRSIVAEERNAHLAKRLNGLPTQITLDGVVV